jgi:hypothetical protein
VRTSFHSSNFIILLCFALAACVGKPPVREYNLTATAMKAAKLAGAAKLANGYYTKAEDFYRQGEKYYTDREFDQAKAQFRQAKLFAERAENLSVLKKASSGETGE